MQKSEALATYSLEVKLLLALSAVRSGVEDRILAVLDDEHMQFSAVSSLTSMDKAQVSRAIDKLAQRRLVSTKIERKQKYIRLTGAGRRAKAVALHARTQVETAALRRLTATECGTLHRLLQKIGRP